MISTAVYDLPFAQFPSETIPRYNFLLVGGLGQDSGHFQLFPVTRMMEGSFEGQKLRSAGVWN